MQRTEYYIFGRSIWSLLFRQWEVSFVPLLAYSWQGSYLPEFM